MVQRLTKLSPQLAFWLLSIIYGISYILPTYLMPPLFRENIAEIPQNSVDLEQVLYGYQCALAALASMFDSPISFLGSLANIAVGAMFILQFLRLPGKLTMLKSALVIICIVSTLIWAVALRVGLKEGYYIWTFACIGMSFAFTAQKPYLEDFEDILLDEHTIAKDID
jgi:hypothetical protein